MQVSFALSQFIKPHAPHLHPPFSRGGFRPAAPQSNPPPAPVPAVVVVNVEPNPVELEPNLGVPRGNADEVVDVDAVELDPPNTNGPGGGVGIENVIFEPASDPREGVPGLGSSQNAHFSFADAWFIESQVPHFHSPVFVEGGFSPAEVQSNPPGLGFTIVELLPEPNAR